MSRLLGMMVSGGPSLHWLVTWPKEFIIAWPSLSRWRWSLGPRRWRSPGRSWARAVPSRPQKLPDPRLDSRGYSESFEEVDSDPGAGDWVSNRWATHSVFGSALTSPRCTAVGVMSMF